MSFLKQLLTPFIDFDEQKVNEPAQQKTPAAVAPTHVPADVSDKHPLISDNTESATSVEQLPTYSQSGTLTGPLPEHEEYFEKLVEDANANNPLFKGADYKEFVDSRMDIDDITDETIKYRTAYNVLKGSGLTKEKLLSTGQEYINIIGRDLNAFQSAHAVQYNKQVRPKEQVIQKKSRGIASIDSKIKRVKGRDQPTNTGDQPVQR